VKLAIATAPDQRTDDILGQLGYSAAEIARLREAGVVA
jgi:crotonobetainyl-CoA:carnitine CoA-transferase CaiB-like acyl-CoA transferase